MYTYTILLIFFSISTIRIKNEWFKLLDFLVEKSKAYIRDSHSFKNNIYHSYYDYAKVIVS